MMLFSLLIVFALAAPATALAQSSLPDPAATPGAINPAVMQVTIDTTICLPGWTHTVRPPAKYTEQMKREQMREAGYADDLIGDFEEDHLIPIGLGGAPSDPRNLWLEPRDP